ncbi:MAG: hypothetical protein ACOY4T_01220 [Pseudomonadota bacterium]
MASSGPGHRSALLGASGSSLQGTVGTRTGPAGTPNPTSQHPPVSTQGHHDRGSRAHRDQPSLPAVDEDALDIADYLKAEADDLSDIHTDQTLRQGFAALTLGAVGVVYGDIGTSRNRVVELGERVAI